MTFDDAYAQLALHWPGRSFCISRELWCHRSHGEERRKEEFSIFDATAKVSYAGPTLEAALARAGVPLPVGELAP